MSDPYRTLLPERPVREAVRRRIHQRGGDGDLGLVLDLAALEERCTTAVAAAARHDVGLLCAVKACTRPEVLARAAGCGLGFDVANLPELERVQAFGTPVSLTSPAIPLAELPRLHAALRRRELQRWHCDSLGQLEALARACPGATVGVRVNLDGLPVPDDMPLWRDSRFGIRLEELPLARDIAAAHGCRLGYLHVHNGSERNDLASFVFAAGRIVEAARAHAIELDGLDLGGGLLVDATTGAMNAFFGAVRRAAGPEVALTFEPGRFWLTDCVSLVTQVLDVKPLHERIALVLDFGLMSHLQWSDWLRLPTLGPFAPGDQRPWKVCGRSCFEGDMLEEHEVVPVAPGAPLPRVGDAFVIGNVTSYSSELACDFNGIARPALELVA